MVRRLLNFYLASFAVRIYGGIRVNAEHAYIICFIFRIHSMKGVMNNNPGSSICARRYKMHLPLFLGLSMRP